MTATPRNSSDLLPEGLACAERGWAVFPCHTVTAGPACTCGKADCGENAGKHPRTRHGFYDATLDRAVIRRWAEWWPEANLAIRTGEPSGIVVLDVDPRHDGDATLADLEREHGLLPATVEAITGGGGRHLYFRHPGGIVPNSQGDVGAGLDVRGDGGYVLVPPSRTAGRYAWEVSSHPDDTALAAVPPWLLTLMRRPSSQWHAPKSLAEPIPNGEKRAHYTSLVGALRRRHAPDSLILETLRVVNQRCAVEPSPDEHLVALVRSTARWDDGGTQHPSLAGIRTVSAEEIARCLY
jgi:hypothetical protein